MQALILIDIFKYLHISISTLFSAFIEMSSPSQSPLPPQRKQTLVSGAGEENPKQQQQQQQPQALTGYVGFDSITAQIERKLVKRGFTLNLMVVGKARERKKRLPDEFIFNKKSIFRRLSLASKASLGWANLPSSTRCLPHISSTQRALFCANSHQPQTINLLLLKLQTSSTLLRSLRRMESDSGLLLRILRVLEI